MIVSLMMMGGTGKVPIGQTASSVMSGASSSPASIVTGSMSSKATSSLHSTLTSSITTSLTGSVTTGITTSGTVSALSKPQGAPVTLSAYSEELARILKFDRQVLILVKEESHERIQRLVGYDEDDYQIVAPGIAVVVPEDKADEILVALRRKLTPLKYMAFFVEVNAAFKAEKIGVIKGTDQYEILRIMHTDGDEYEITNQDVIERLKEWQKISTFEVIGADSSWVEVEFTKLPKDLNAFAQEVYDFSPDSVDEGPGTVEGLAKEIKKTKRLFLVWD